jgi:predicted Zn-dependent protease
MARDRAAEWTPERARATIEQILSLRTQGDGEVAITARASSNTRFARNEITTSGFTRDLAVRITSVHEGRAGTITTNDLSPAGLKAAVARAEELRALTPPDPEMMELLPKQEYPALVKFHPESAAARAKKRAAGVKATLALAARQSLTAAGFYENESVIRAIGNSKGNFGFHRATDVSFSTTMRTADATGSGWAGGSSPRFAEVDPTSLARRAADKGVASARPREAPPGDYTVILEPEAVANLLQYLQFGALLARAADEGRSVFSKEGGGSRIGEKVAHESVSIVSDPFDPRVPGSPWSGGGFFEGRTDPIPNRRVAWIEKGVLKALHTDRYWAKETGKEPTPFPGSVVMAGGTQTLEELIASTDKGLLVTRFWYIRGVNPQTAQLTGLTRDGLFIIEKGKITGPAVNLRFNESPVVMLQNVEGLTPAVPAGGMVLPAIKSRAFTFTSRSDAV